MLLLLKLIGSAISAFFKALFAVVKVVYRILSLLRVRLLALWLLVSAVLALCGVFGRVGMGWFWAGVALCGAATLLSWAFALRKRRKRKALEREEPAEETEKPAEETEKPEEEKERPAEEEEPPREKPTRGAKRGERPHYYDVEGLPGYFFAEYPDRYELYYRGKNGAERIRTDWKEGEENG